MGSPPRMRGKVAPFLRCQFFGRITPAHAGKSCNTSCCRILARDHPRACGEKIRNLYRRSCGIGSPPRMRGKDVTFPYLTYDAGITPAHAGKSLCWGLAYRGGRDHPRACGEKEVLDFGQFITPGSPPRMRGKGDSQHAAACTEGITPAHAGKSKTHLCTAVTVQDHPRACGEKWQRLPFRRPRWGSPPRMRGKVLGVACAILLSWDHPRACGEKPGEDNTSKNICRITPAHAGKSHQ